jgi:MYXO-CTERM domain-containing protein
MQTMSGLNDTRRLGKRQGRAGSQLVVGAALLSLGLLLPRPAEACGGFFCSTANPVNQAAERIIFAQNAGGTVTAVIEIQYQGPSENFSWLLPISSVPTDDQIAVASNVAFQRLQQATNPQYSLNTRVEGTCDARPEDGRGFATSDSAGPSAALPGSDKGVTVEASGAVGAFEWTVISLDDQLSDPAAAAVQWLMDSGYDVPQGAPGLLGPYLEDGLYLLALRLKKGADAGSIRPIVLTYAADRPMIPIKLTAVAANDDMGVLTWLLGDARAVPQNYYSLELNEARINWFNAALTYNDVVTAAADDAGGQGFVTEMSGSTETLRNVVWSEFDEQQWQSVKSYQGNALWMNSQQNYSGYDGFWDTVQAHVTLSDGLTLEQLKACSGCYGVEPDAGFAAALEESVIEPVRLVQKLIDAHPQVTRLYSTLSAAEMTVDPLFSFNADLEPVSNIHTADRVIECAPGYYQDEAPWRIELPSGGIVRGGPTDVGTWPTALDSQPANRRILRVGESGAGKVVEDNSMSIEASLQGYSDSLPMPPRRDTSSGCSFNGGAGSGAWFVTALGLAGLYLGRRRQRSAAR